MSILATFSTFFTSKGARDYLGDGKTRGNTRKHEKRTIKGTTSGGPIRRVDRKCSKEHFLRFCSERHYRVRGLDREKHEKTRKTRENTSQKPFTGNTVEQYAGLKFMAASLFFDISFRNIKKAGSGHSCKTSSMQAWDPEWQQSCHSSPAWVGPRWPFRPSGSRGTKGVPGCEKP